MLNPANQKAEDPAAARAAAGSELEGPLLDLLRAARSAGLRISPAESIEAARATALVGWGDRLLLRDTLGMVVAKTVAEKQAFGACFDLFFKREAAAPPPPAPEDDTAPGDDDGPLARMLLAGDAAGLAAAIEGAAAEVRLTDIALFTQVNMYTRRILERMGLGALDRAIAAAEGSPRGARLAEGREALRGQVRDLVQQNLALFADGQMEAFRERMLRQTRMAAIDRRDQERMRVLVRAMARRLATLYGRSRKRDRRGVLDVRRTLRRNMAWDGVPFRTIWRQEKIQKPRLVVLCDVSGSVAAYAQFLLLFLHTLREALAGLHAFAFAGDLLQVTEILRHTPVERAIPEIVARIGGSSNYGNVLLQFEAEHMDLLDSQTTVIVLGDGRGNRTDPRAEVLARIAHRSHQVVWLNPEPRTVWGSGDSDMPRYLPHCRIARVCATLDQLARVVEDLLSTRS